MPRRNLPPDAEAWGRQVDTVVSDHDTRLVTVEQFSRNTLNGVNDTIRQLSSQIQNIAKQQQDLYAVYQAMPVTLIQDSTVTGFQAGAGEQVRTSISFDVPPGLPNARVWSSLQGWYFSDFNVPLSDVATFRIGVGAQRSQYVTSIPDNMDSYALMGNGVFSTQATGSTLSVTAYSDAGPTLAPAFAENTLTLSALVVFSR